MAAVAAMFTWTRSKKAVPVSSNHTTQGWIWLAVTFGLTAIGDITIRYLSADLKSITPILSLTFEKCLEFQINQIGNKATKTTNGIYIFFTVLTPYIPPTVAIVANLSAREFTGTNDFTSSLRQLVQALGIFFSGVFAWYLFSSQLRSCSASDLASWQVNFLIKSTSSSIINNYIIPFMFCFILVTLVLTMHCLAKIVKLTANRN
jgi:hypothetical protein